MGKERKTERKRRNALVADLGRFFWEWWRRAALAVGARDVAGGSPMTSEFDVWMTPCMCMGWNGSRVYVEEEKR